MKKRKFWRLNFVKTIITLLVFNIICLQLEVYQQKKFFFVVPKLLLFKFLYIIFGFVQILLSSTIYISLSRTIVRMYTNYVRMWQLKTCKIFLTVFGKKFVFRPFFHVLYFNISNVDCLYSCRFPDFLNVSKYKQNISLNAV